MKNPDHLHCPANRGFAGSLLKLSLIVPILLGIGGCVTVKTTTPVDHAGADAFHRPENAKVVLVVLENKNADSALNKKELPFLWKVAHEGAFLSRYYGVAHPSLPNYIALVSGSTDGVRGDFETTLNRKHLGRRLTKEGRTWKVYAESYPSGKSDLRMRIGPYARKHVPFLSFVDVQQDPALHITGVEPFQGLAKAAVCRIS